MRWLVLTSLFTCLPGATDARCGDRARLQGTWRVVAMRSNGEALHDAGGQLDDDQFLRALDFRFTFHGDRLSVTGNFQGFGEPGGRDAILTFTLNPQARPKALDIRRTWGSSVSVQPAIYEFQGDRLRICFGAKGRPKSFEARRGSHDLLYEFERAKDESRDHGGKSSGASRR